MAIEANNETEQAIRQLFQMAGIDLPPGDISGSQMQDLVSSMQSKLTSVEPSPGALGGLPSLVSLGSLEGGLAKPRGSGNLTGQHILIVGELGIVTYQLKLSLCKLGANVTIVRGVDEALSEYGRKAYSAALIDIFMPTQREGLLVLMELKRMSQEKQVETTFVILASTTREKSIEDLNEMCTQRGASLVVDKIEGWHKRILDYFKREGEFS